MIAPRLAYLAAVVARLLGCPADDPRVSGALTSVQAQLMVVVKSPISEKLGFRR